MTKILLLKLNNISKIRLNYNLFKEMEGKLQYGN